MLSDDDLKCLESNAAVGGVMGPWRDMLDLIDEVRRLRDLVDMSTTLDVGDVRIYRSLDRSYYAVNCGPSSTLPTFPTLDEAVAYARERSGR